MLTAELCIHIGIAALVLKAIEYLFGVIFFDKGPVMSAEPIKQHRCDTEFTNQQQDPYDPSPRFGYLTWDDYFMAIAFLSAQRSKDPNRQVGACIVSKDNVILGIGYNGFPRGCPDHKLPWAKRSAEGDPLGTKYPYVVHAEVNAILNKNISSVEGAKIYVTLFPCNECAKLLIQAGIKEVIFHKDKHGVFCKSPQTESKVVPGNPDTTMYCASQRMLEMVGVKIRQHSPGRTVTVRL